MSATVRTPTMTREQFFDWAEAQNERYEFDGFEPVLMTGGKLGHNLVLLNVQFALRTRLTGKGCQPLGPDSGVATIGDTVRYPDGVVTCSPIDPDSRLVPNPVVVFEVISPTSGRIDRIVKVREYAAVASVRRYVIVESSTIGLTVMEREAAGEHWTLSTLIAEDVLRMPEIGGEIPVAALYEGLDFPV